MCRQLGDVLCQEVYPGIVAGVWNMCWAHQVGSDRQCHKEALLWVAVGWMGSTGYMHEGSDDFVGLGMALVMA